MGFTLAVSLSAPLVQACEGDCIVGITKALIGNYTPPVTSAMSDLAGAIQSQLIPDSKKPPPALTYLNPIVDEYNKRAYDNMEHAVFKSYFHGKCQDPVTGIDPPGCPNPDCPVVCGTPGSIVHFYSTFQRLAFNATVNLVDKLTHPSSASYKKVEKAVLEAAKASSHKHGRRFLRFMRSSESVGKAGGNEPSGQAIGVKERRQESIKRDLQALLRKFRSLLTLVCRGTSDDPTNDLSGCSWEHEFKEYILTFP
ncbi:hypothetical protein M413DRAFT_64012 [Hebeloma cylindrosporum]|uniref:Uncharacterized protein n=1 Tax=Hebeloma cylindrosporum TaxID=76867 RepID=A0A0C3CE43_HEBCY|nr:hypothetical protein M413DRAFT_64012 [Hebeloma cylindrosporum h7]